MGLLKKLVLLMILSTAVVIGYLWHTLSQTPPLPRLDSKWWGPGQPQKVDESIRQFKVNISEEVLLDLQRRLELTKPFVQPLEGVSFEYGFNTNYLKEVVHFWKTKYNWRQRETFLNSFPQFKTYVDGLNIHFIHIKPKDVPKSARVLPLLLLHGWPGSVREFYDLIPLLTKPNKGTDFVFEVIAPSLPGYGFSDGASKPGLGPAQVAVVMKNLMQRLGFNKFYVQGGDWGALIATNMATLFPDRILGEHSNMCFVMDPLTEIKKILGSFWPTLIVDEAYVDRMYPLGKYYSFMIEEMGYMHIQATKPDTVGVALRESPVGLAAYILEKFSTWTNPEWKKLPDGGLTKKYSLTNLLDNVMIYWVTGSITTSVRLYSEAFTKEQLGMQLDSIPSQVPTGCAMYPYELGYVPESFLKRKFEKLIHYTNMPRGGHFAAFEEPQLLADDIWATIKTIENMKTV